MARYTSASPRSLALHRGRPEGLQYLAVGAPVAEEDGSEIEQGWWSD